MKRGRVTSAEFRKNVKVGDVVTCTWNYGFGTHYRKYRVAEILVAADSPYPAQGRELVLDSVDGCRSQILVRELRSDTMRLTAA